MLVTENGAMQSHQLINQTSGKTEYYTPPEIVRAARLTMGGIDLDPASSTAANFTVVGAKTFYSAPQHRVIGKIGGLPLLRYADRGGLDRAWFGRVWLNHPFGSPQRACTTGCKKVTCVKRGYHVAHDLPGNEDWIGRLVDAYRCGAIEQACCITFASTSEAWFRPLKQFPMCLIDGRTNYIDPDGEATTGATKGSAVTYLGKRAWDFARNFGQLGAVMFPARIVIGIEHRPD